MVLCVYVWIADWFWAAFVRMGFVTEVLDVPLARQDLGWWYHLAPAKGIRFCNNVVGGSAVRIYTAQVKLKVTMAPSRRWSFIRMYFLNHLLVQLSCTLNTVI